jgi:glycosyltransferase involved in cell wall biosynthesis
MSGLKILITNCTFATQSGTETYVRDLALKLLKRGHTPIVYSPQLGEMAREIRLATIPVVDDLNAISIRPDIIHGHHHSETMMALLHFPGVPAVYVCHDWYSDLDCPPRFPRILRYIAIDQTCYDKLVCEYAVPEERIRLLLNFVDVERFEARGPLPPRPQRALLYSNYAADDEYVAVVREACAGAGMTLDVVGERVGTTWSQPEKALGQYDLVFAKGRSALEALAVGAAVVVYCARSVGPLVTTGELERLLPLNFGIRAVDYSDSPEMLRRGIIREIKRYDPLDAAEVSSLIRARYHSEVILDEIMSLYEETIAEQRERGGADPSAEGRATAAYLRWLSQRNRVRFEALNNQATLRFKRRLTKIPIVGKLSHVFLRWLVGPPAR